MLWQTFTLLTQWDTCSGWSHQQLLVCGNNQVHSCKTHHSVCRSGVLAGWRSRLEERAAMCHMLRPCGPLGTCLRPRGHDRPRQLVCFGEVQGKTGRIWGCRMGDGITDGPQQTGGRWCWTGWTGDCGGEGGSFCEKNYWAQKARQQDWMGSDHVQSDGW